MEFIFGLIFLGMFVRFIILLIFKEGKNEQDEIDELNLPF